MKDNIVCNGDPPCKLNANKAVAGVRKWVKDKKIPQYDHIMTFTRYSTVAQTLHHVTVWQGLDLLCLTPLPTIFQLYHGDPF